MRRLNIIERFKKKYGIDAVSMKRAVKFKEQYGGEIGGILLNLGLISEDQLVDTLAEHFGLKRFSEFSDKFDLEAILTYFPPETLKALVRQGSLPIYVENGQVWILTANPMIDGGREIILKNGLAERVRYVIGGERDIRDISSQLMDKLDQNEGEDKDLVEDSNRIKEMAYEAPVIKFVNSTIARGVDFNASDIHFEPFQGSYRIRFRIDGVLHSVDTLEERFYLAVVSRIKLLAGLDIAERRLPQDGKINLRISGKEIDIRVSCFPTVKGEVVVLRLLYQESVSFDIGTLGLEEDNKEIFMKMIQRPYGLLLVTGPTGSGKTTTLYAALSKINLPTRKIITVEDPVEYQLNGINQIQVKPDINLTFANALRSIVRQDPDVIMVGEIRDAETAEIAIHAALTGHLVLSTIHTNDSVSALFRLVEMGVEDYLLNAALLGVVAQRLVRKVCQACSEEVEFPEEFLNDVNSRRALKKYFSGEAPLKYKKGRGCPQCSNTGFKGRIAIFEMFEHTEELREIFMREKSRDKMLSHLRKRGFRTLREDGMLKVIKGITTPQEVFGVV